MHKSLPQFLAATWVVYAVSGFYVNDQAWAYPVVVESESRLIVQDTTHQGRRLSLRLLDESQRGIKKGKIKLSLNNESGEVLLSKELLTDNFGQVEVDLNINPGQYLLKLDYLGDKNVRGCHEELPHHIEPCDARLKRSISEHQWWQKSKPIEVQLSRPLDCLDLELPVIASFGPLLSKRLSFVQGQSQLEFAFDPVSLDDGGYVLALESLDETMFLPFSTSVDIYVYEQVFASTATWVKGYYSDWIDVFAADVFLKDAERLPELVTMAQLIDADGREFTLRTVNNDVGQWRFDLPQAHWDTCIEFDIWPEGQRSLRQRLFVCQDEAKDKKAKTLRTLLWTFALLLLTTSLWGLWLLLKKRSKKPKFRLPKPPQTHREPRLKAPISRLLEAFFPIEPIASSVKITVIDDETKKHISGLTLELWKKGQWTVNRELQTAFGFEIGLEDGHRIKLSHPDYISWEGDVKTKLASLKVELMSRRKFVILCFEAVSQSLLSQASPWGSISPAKVASLPRDSQNTSATLIRFCSLVEVAAFNTTPISDDKIDEIYETARQCMR